MSKRVHMLCNAHIDPVWQWEWEEGAAETLSTFRIAADFCEEYEDFVFCHNEALLYRWIEEYDPQLFAKIQSLVKAGKWNIIGGWHLQPDCNMPSGEAFVRQILEGRLYFAEKFGKTPTTAINFDPFGHSRGLVQIMKKSGFDSYLFCRPGEANIHLPEGPFVWVGYDGSTVLGQRLPDYGSALGKAADKIRGYAESRRTDSDYDACLWGVGDHGGGASRRDLAAIAELKKEYAEKDILLLHATPEEFFARAAAEQAALEAKGESLYRREGDLNLWAPGCYTSQIRVKQGYRRLENELFAAEKMCIAAESAGMAWPAAEFSEVLYDLLTVQFHDSLPGSSIQPVEDMILRKIDHALEILSRVRTRAFYALAKGQPAAGDDQIPILAFNPHPWPVEADLHCEMMLWDQNWADEFSMPQVWQNGTPLPTQCEKEDSNLNLDWRKRAVFRATLAPMQMNRFDCTYTRIPAKPVPDQKDGPCYHFETDRVAVDIDRTTGTLTRYAVDGKEFLLPGGCALDVIADNEDPWGMTVESFEEVVGTFAPMTPEAYRDFCGVEAPLAPVRVVEEGAVRTVVEVALCWGSSRAVLRYLLPADGTDVGVQLRVQWAETHKLLKLRVPGALNAPALLGQVAFGTEELPMTGRENVAQRWAALSDGSHALGIINDGTYGLSGKDGTLWLTLLRSPAYTGHPINDRKIIPQDRYTAHIDQGERLFGFVLTAGEADAVVSGISRKADAAGEKPVVLSFFPAGNDGCVPQAAPLTLSDGVIQMPALKKTADGRGCLLRLFNPTAETRSTAVESRLLNAPLTVTLGKYEAASWRIENGKAIPCDLMENPL